MRCLTAGLAGGTILYIVMFEVLQREKEKNVPGIFQLTGILLGFVAMMMIDLFGRFIHGLHHTSNNVPGQHDHSHEEQGEASMNTTLQHLHHLGVHSESAQPGHTNTSVLSVLGIIN